MLRVAVAWIKFNYAAARHTSFQSFSNNFQSSLLTFLLAGNFFHSGTLSDNTNFIISNCPYEARSNIDMGFTHVSDFYFYIISFYRELDGWKFNTLWKWKKYSFAILECKLYTYVIIEENRIWLILYSQNNIKNGMWMCNYKSNDWN